MECSGANEQLCQASGSSTAAPACQPYRNLDTGADDTTLYPSFRDALSREETAKIRSKREKRAGAGVAIQIPAEMIPLLRFEVLRTPVPGFQSNRSFVSLNPN
jgi:hypothetical protein